MQCVNSKRMTLCIVMCRLCLDQCSIKSFFFLHITCSHSAKNTNIFKALVKKYDFPRISDFSQGQVEKITQGEL